MHSKRVERWLADNQEAKNVLVKSKCTAMNCNVAGGVFYVLNVGLVVGRVDEIIRVIEA